MKIPRRKPHDDRARDPERRRWQKPRNWSWRKAALVVAGILVVAWLGRGLLPEFGTSGAGEGTGGSEAGPARPKPPEVVDLDGKKVPAIGGPVAVLNPGLARPGATVGVNGSGFDPGASVQVFLTTGNGKPTPVAAGKADRHGSLTTEFEFPAAAATAGNQHLVTLQQANSDKVAEAELVAQAGVATASVSDQAAAPGSSLTVNASGFMPGENIKVYWGRVAGEPTATFKADESGAVSKQTLTVGVGPTGPSSLILVGDKSQSAAVAPFTMLSLYPSAAAKPYAARAGDNISVAGKGFAPGERVLVYFNQATGSPVFAQKANARGAVAGMSFKIPFGLKGKQSLILIGEQSRASANTGFSVMPYSPSARANTYGGLPGTTLTFYVKDFAPNEAVHVYANRGPNSQGELVSAFRVDEKGTAAAAGSYVIPGNASGKLSLTLVGTRSEGSATATVTVDKVDGPVNVPPQPKYTLPPDLED